MTDAKYDAAVTNFNISSANLDERIAFLNAWYDEEFHSEIINEFAEETEEVDYATEQEYMDAFVEFAEDHSPKIKGSMVREMLLEHAPDQVEMVMEYVDEAEHQDGIHVWDNMYEGSEENIRANFDLYSETVKENRGDKI